MSASQKLLNVILVLGIGLALVASFRGPASTFGGAGFYESYPIHFGGGLYAGANKQLAIGSSGQLTVGASGTALSQVIDTTCTGIAYAALAASSSARLDCAVTGVVSTDRVAVVLPLAASNGASSFAVAGAAASSTAGYVSFW